MSSTTPSSELNAAIVIARIQDGSYPRETILHIARGFLPLPQECLDQSVEAFMGKVPNAAVPLQVAKEVVNYAVANVIVVQDQFALFSVK